MNAVLRFLGSVVDCAVLAVCAVVAALLPDPEEAESSQ